MASTNGTVRPSRLVTAPARSSGCTCCLPLSLAYPHACRHVRRGARRVQRARGLCAGGGLGAGLRGAGARRHGARPGGLAAGGPAHVRYAPSSCVATPACGRMRPVLYCMHCALVSDLPNHPPTGCVVPLMRGSAAAWIRFALWLGCVSRRLAIHASLRARVTRCDCRYYMLGGASGGSGGGKPTGAAGWVYGRRCVRPRAQTDRHCGRPAPPATAASPARACV